MEEIKWNDQFNLGVEIIDRAHQKLFSIVNKLVALSEDPVKQPYACREGIKYFKGYTLKHFAENICEKLHIASMKSINRYMIICGIL